MPRLTTANPGAPPEAARPRVLFLSHETTLSGAPMQLLYAIPQLQRRGWEIVFAAPERGPISDALEQAGTPVRFEPTFLTDIEHVKLRELCRDFDVVVANTIAAWPAVRAAAREGIPVVWYIHETLVGIHLIGQISEIRPTLDLADVIITPTRQTARVYQGLTRTSVEVVPYGIPDLGYALRVAATDAPTKFLLLGSYEERKGQDIFLEALHRMDAGVRERGSFTLAGRPLDRAFFDRATAKAAMFPNVQLLTGLEHADAARLMTETDVLVISSRDETMPISIIEALSLGRAVITSDVGGIREWIRDGLNGFLVPPEDGPALADAISRSISDPPGRAAIAETGRRSYERHFRVETFSENFSRVVLRAWRGEIPPAGRQTCSYDEWLREFDTPATAERAELRRRMRHLTCEPLISVLMPVYNPEPDFLRAAIESVKAQLYPRWELCIADDASTDSRIRPLLEEALASDDRIKVVFRPTNGHISACSNSALALATGEWCALLDHDDTLSEGALAYVAQEIDRRPDAALIYSDEDKIDAAGVRSNPFFKSDYDSELFLAQNYINHLGIYRRVLLNEIGGFREGFEGSQDYDLALRVLERISATQVRHIPRILYHWRTAGGSLAAAVDAKPYARGAARRAIADHLRRRQVAGAVEPCPENHESHRVRYDVPDPAPLVSVIIPMRDRVELLEHCLASVGAHTVYPALEVIVVDNGSTEAKTREFLAELQRAARARVLRDDGEFNFSRLNNLAAREARGDLLLFMNNDIEATSPGWLAEMVSEAAQPDVGAVGARLWYPNDTLQHGGVVLGLGGVAGHAHTGVPRGHPGYFNRAWLQHQCSAVTAACMLVKRVVFEQLGGFEERNLAVNFNDTDLCLRIVRAGFRIVWTPYADLTHHESSSRGHHATRAQQAQFFAEASYMQQKWGRELLNDPFYSPNLSLKLPGYEIACRPKAAAN